MVFLETAAATGGELLRIDTFNPPSETREPEHVHPQQESGLELVSGSLRLSVAGEERSQAPGGSITIPAGVPHHFWNDGEEEAHAIQWFRPALRTEAFFESYFALAQDGKLDEKGMPNLFQLAVSTPAFGNEIRVTRPPWPAQRMFAALVGPIARRRGYRAEYRRA
jgi:quercetin dioxygenase-like cupin family protein